MIQKKETFFSRFTENALRWLEANVSVNVCTDLEAKFQETFEETRLELNLASESGKMLTRKVPLSYIFHVLSHITINNQTVTELKKNEWIN